MFFKLTLLIIILVLFYLLLEYSTQRETFKINDYKSKKNAIQNFIAYPDKQPFCASLYSSKAKYWSKLPQEFCKGLYVKYCCTGCYYKICKSISCSNNKVGLYIVGKLNDKDISNLKKYYNKNNKIKNNNNSLGFEFNEKKIKKLKGKYVLKYRHMNKYYPIQVLKQKKDLDRFDITMDKFIKKKFKCKNTLKKKDK